MDQDTRAAFDALMALTIQNRDQGEKCLRILEHHDERMERLEDDHAAIKREVFGSKPPPPSAASTSIAKRVAANANGSQPPEPTVHRKVSEHENEIVDLAGGLAAVRAEVKEARSEVQEARGEVRMLKDDLKTVKDINVAQSKNMGLSKPEDSPLRKVGKFFASRNGQAFLIQLVIVVLGALGYKTATESRDQASQLQGQIQRSEENVVRTVTSAAPAASNAPR